MLKRLMIAVTAGVALLAPSLALAQDFDEAEQEGSGVSSYVGEINSVDPSGSLVIDDLFFVVGPRTEIRDTRNRRLPLGLLRGGDSVNIEYEHRAGGDRKALSINKLGGG